MRPATVTGLIASRSVLRSGTVESLVCCTPAVAAALCVSIGWSVALAALVALVCALPLLLRHRAALRLLLQRLRPGRLGQLLPTRA